MTTTTDGSPVQTLSINGVGLTLHHDGPITPEQLLTMPRLAIVGARACTEYGAHVAKTLAQQATQKGYVVISGGAYGIDAAAHRGALEAGGKTIAVLGCGVDRDYPMGNARMLQEIRQTGAVFSEYADGNAPNRISFLARNKVIALLATHVVVVEAAMRSGSMSTATHALQFNRHLYAVPGSIYSAMSDGPNAMLKANFFEDGWGPARCLTNLGDLVDFHQVEQR